MRVALTYNLRLRADESEAEYDSRETIDAIVRALRSHGHQVDPIEASGPAARIVARLEASSPDLVFNIAAGRRGRFREAFFPALLSELGLPFTGSDAYACAVSLDKGLTKLKLERAGVRVARGVFHDGSVPLDVSGLRFPLIVKPNFEGSSIGIGADAIVARTEDVPARVAALLARFPAGVLIEEYIQGKDVVVGLLERAKRKSAILAPGELVFAPEVASRRSFAVYDYQIRESGHHVSLRAPAAIDPKTAELVAKTSERAFRALSIRDVGLMDFRVTEAGEIYFLEVDPIPSLGVDASLVSLARASGVGLEGGGLEAVVDAIVHNACARHGIDARQSATRVRKSTLRVGLTFNLKRIKPGQGGTDDDEAEYDSPSTIQAIHDAIASHGHDVVDLEATPDLASTIGSMGIDVVFNVAEGIRGRNREGHVPSLLELLGIEYTGSDPATLSITLDKGLAKRICKQAGVPTPEWFGMRSAKDKLPKGLSFPVVVKPIAEGSSKGVLGTCVAEDERELREKAAAIIARYRQPALVEAFLPGREFTVALLGEKKPRVLPPMEIVFTRKDVKNPVYTFDHKLEPTDEIRYDAPAKVDPELQRDIEHVARAAFGALGCRDVARIDGRLDAKGKPHFIECNPLPGLTPDWSDICLIGKGVGMDYRTLIGEILAPAVRRFRAREKP